MKTATITEVNESNPFETKYGMLHPHWIKLDNGDEGVANKKKPAALSAGQRLTYEIEVKKGRNGLYNKIKEVKEKSFGGGGRTDSVAGYAMRYAVDVLIANIETSGTPLKPETAAERIIALATPLYEWMEARK